MKKYVLITGASSGIGKELAMTLANAGYLVFAGARKPEDMRILNEANSSIIPVMVDVTDEESINEAFDFVLSHTTCLNAIINNAGMVIGGAIEYLSVDDIKRQFDVNTFGAVRVAQKFMPLLPQGKIINISSMASTGIFPFISPYCASKRALDILFNSLLIELDNPKIKIVSVKPGAVKTPLWQRAIDSNRNILANVPAKFAQKYKKEFEMLEANARENTKKGIDTSKVCALVLKVLHSKNPKPSYNCGVDSHGAELFSRLPLRLVNFTVKKILKKRISKFAK